jgi:hypothetical protein
MRLIDTADIRLAIDVHGMCNCGTDVKRADGSMHHFSNCDIDDHLRYFLEGLPEEGLIITRDTLVEALLSTTNSYAKKADRVNEWYTTPNDLADEIIAALKDLSNEL